MTGHSYKTTDAGISEILEEWKLFYPHRFDMESSPSLPAAIEVVLGGVRMRYPSQVLSQVVFRHACSHLSSDTMISVEPLLVILKTVIMLQTL